MRRIRLGIALAALLSLMALLVPGGAVAQAASVPYADRLADEAVTSRINMDRALADLEYYTMEIGPRLGGTPAENQAAQWLASQLEELGYEVWLQPFAASNKVVSTVDIPDGPRPYGRALQGGAAANGRFTEGETITAGLVDAGTGLTPEDFPADTAGKIAIITYGANNTERNTQVANAIAAGAVGVIYTRPQATPFDPSITTPVNIPVLGMGNGQGAYLRTRVGAGLGDVTIDTRRYTNLTSYNVFASKAPTHPLPSEEEPKIALISAHYDSVRGAPGANDDGSGTLLTLELARVFADLPTAREIRFAFWGAEEQGLIGSNFYVNNAPASELDRYIGQWQNDMVGTSWEPADRYNLLAVDGQPNLVNQSVAAAAQRLGYDDVVIGPIVRGGSDHVPFHNRGIPSGNFSWRPESGPGNLEPQYHTPEDTIANNISPTRWRMSMEMIGTSVYSEVRLGFETLAGEVDHLVASGGITEGMEGKIRNALAQAEAWLELDHKFLPALSHLDRAIHLLLWQADVIENKNKPNQGDADGLRALAALIQAFQDQLRG